jgi:hypothetical protein
MGWRKIQEDDIERGVIIRIRSIMEDGGYCMATVIFLNQVSSSVKVARPMAYAHESWNDNTALLTEEVFDVSVDRLIAHDSDYEVFESASGIRKLAL